MGMIERTFTCPIVFEVMEQLKQSLGFRCGAEVRRYFSIAFPISSATKRSS
jgi:hypothetical protein